MPYDDPFAYQWDDPFQTALLSAPPEPAPAPPPLRPPPPQRLTLEELLALRQPFTPPPKPEDVTDLSDLDPATRKRVQQQGLFEGMAAMGAAMSSRDWSQAGRGVQQIGALKQGAIDAANAKAQSDWQEQAAAGQAAYQGRQASQQAAALYGMYQSIAAAEPPGSPFVAQAEAAARSGDMSQLATLKAQEPLRQSARAKGLDPDAWDTNARLQDELKAELQRQAAAAAWPEKQRELTAEAQIKSDAELAGRRAQLKAGVLWQPPQPPQYEPLDRVAARLELEQQIKSKYETAKGQATRLGQLADGTWAEIRHSAADGTPASITPIPGQPVKVGKLLAYKNSSGDEMVYNPQRPELGAVPMTEYRAGDKGAPTVKDLMAATARPAVQPPPAPSPPPPPPTITLPPAAKAPMATGVRDLATQALLQGGSPADGLTRLRQRFPQGVDGVPPEQIIASALIEARKRGWKPPGQ